MGIERFNRQQRPLKRVEGSRSERRTVIVFTEGKRSEPDYVKALKTLPHVGMNVALNLELHPEHGVPLTLVEFAIDRKNDPEVDECWCLFDVEWPKHHPNLKKAITLARAHDINLAISNPCFELWLVLHHKSYQKFCDTDEIESYSRSLDSRPGKSIDALAYMPLRKLAARRARALQVRHSRNGTDFPNDNPSSGMFKFLEALEGDIDSSAEEQAPSTSGQRRPRYRRNTP